MFINSQLVSFVKGCKWDILKTCLLSVILTETSTLISLILAVIVRIILGQETIFYLVDMKKIVMLLSGLVCIKYVLNQMKQKAGIRCGLRIKEKLRKDMLEKLFELGPGYLSEEKTGNVATTIFSKVEWLGHYYTQYIPTGVAAIINAAFILTFLFYVNWIVAIVCSTTFIVMLACPMSFYRVMSERGKKEWEAEEAYYAECLDGIQGIVTLKSFNADEKQKRRMHAAGESLRKTVMGQLKVTMLENGLLEFAGRVGSAFSIALSAYLVYQKEIESDWLIYVMFLISACFVPMLNLIPAWHMGYRGVTASESIEELLGSKARFQANIDTEPDRLSPFEGNITFEGVDFAYNEEDGDVLKDISFIIENRTSMALVGSSGSGKSTIAGILAGFYPVTHGRVTVGNLELNEHNLSQIQNLISVVWQEGHLFYATVGENIKIGKPTATDEEIVEVCKKANIHDFIMSLPKGYQTHIGEEGMRFSGGEKQRIAIARAFLRDRPILILDEATSSLDRKNEKEIQDSIAKLSQGKTVLMIAHRISTIQNADQICVMEKGKIETLGKHEMLQQESALYQRLLGV